jgi:hypothetical protein
MFPVCDDPESTAYGLPLPWFRIEDLAKFFFVKTKDWIRWLHRDAPGYPKGHFLLDGVPIVPKRTRAGYRAFSLPDIERMAYALHQDGRLADEDLGQILALIRQVAVRYKVLEPQ